MIHRFSAPLVLFSLGVFVLCSCSLQDQSPEDDSNHGHKHSPEQTSVSTPFITGEGNHTYRMNPEWNDVPNSHIGPTHGDVVVDREGTIYVSTERNGHSIMVYAPDGEHLRSFGNEHVGLHHLTLRNEDGSTVLYAAHLAGKQIVKFRSDGTVLWEMGYDTFKQSGKYDSRKQFKPTAVAVGPDGDLYVADGYGTSWIHQFDRNRQYLRSFGGPGTKPGKFKTCHGIALDTRYDEPRLLISDRENRRLQHFDLEGNLIEVAATDLRRPCKVAFHGSSVAVAELEGRVTILNRQNKPVTHLGDNPKEWQWANYNIPPDAWKKGAFTAPHGHSFDQNGNLYVQDWNKTGRLTKLERRSK